jgi:hypothetical protein
MFKFKILSCIIISLFFIGAGCKELPSKQQIDYVKDVKPLIEEKGARKVRGSCDVIATKSTCVDFIGSIFTEDRMKLSCTEGKFSLNSCPYSDLGGCQATADTISESIAWSYNYGGAPITTEEASYQAKACNALAVGKWVKPADLLKSK